MGLLGRRFLISEEHVVAAARHVTFDPTHTATALVPKWCSVVKEVADCDERDDAAVHRARALSSHACRSVAR